MTTNWSVFHKVNLLYTVNWLITLNEISWIPHRVPLFFEYIPAIEFVGLVIFSIIRPKLSVAIFSALLLQFILFIIMGAMLSMYAALGDNPDFFK